MLLIVNVHVVLGLMTGAGEADSVIGASVMGGPMTNGDAVERSVDVGTAPVPASVQPTIIGVVLVLTAMLSHTIVTLPVVRSICHWKVAGLLVPISKTPSNVTYITPPTSSVLTLPLLASAGWKSRQV
jgi:hypothetical protein